MYKQDLALNNLQGLICHETNQLNLDIKWIKGEQKSLLVY